MTQDAIQEPPDATASSDIAIIGLAAIMPGAPTTADFWSNIVRGITGIVESPQPAGGRSAAFVAPVELDPSLFAIATEALASLDPLHLLALEAGRRALADASFERRNFEPRRALLVLGAADVRGSGEAAARIAAALGLHGPSFASAAASTDPLAPLELGLEQLHAGACDVVLCCAADSRIGLAAQAAEDSTVPGEGAAALVLKRLDGARHDGDSVYAVITPRVAAPDEIGLIETTGGITAGDLERIGSALAGASPGSIALGSLLPFAGDTGAAAGIAVVIKAALSLRNGVLPPVPGLMAADPPRDPHAPLSLEPAPRPWSNPRRRAAVFSPGTGDMALLESLGAPDAGAGYAIWPSELFLFHGSDTAAARARVETLAALVEDDPPWSLRDLARSASHGAGDVRIAVVASSLEELRARLVKAAALQPDNDGVYIAADSLGETPKLAFLYPGQGSQGVGMLRELFVAFPWLQPCLTLDPAVADLMFPPTAWDEDARSRQRAAITDTRAAQPSLGIGGLAITQLLQALAIAPDMVAGHSYGELVALYAAGVYSAADLVKLSSQRALCILAAAEQAEDHGTMAAIGAPPEKIQPHIAGIDGVVMANLNSARQTVISGTTAAVRSAIERLSGAGLSCIPLDVACAFHSPVVAAGADSFLEALERVAMASPRVTVFSNTGAGTFSTDVAAIRRRLAQQVAAPVQFQAEVEAMYEAGARIFVEAGPGRVLTGLTSRNLGSRLHLAVAVDVPGQNGVTQLLRALGQLAVAGVRFDHERLFDGREAQRFDLESPPSRQPKPGSWRVDGRSAQPEAWPR